MSASQIPEAKETATEEQTTVQKMLIENSQLILTIVEYQKLGRINDAMPYQELLHRNLLYLANLVDPMLALEVQEIACPAQQPSVSNAVQLLPPQEAFPLPQESFPLPQESLPLPQEPFPPEQQSFLPPQQSFPPSQQYFPPAHQSSSRAQQPFQFPQDSFSFPQEASSPSVPLLNPRAIRPHPGLTIPQSPLEGSLTQSHFPPSNSQPSTSQFHPNLASALYPVPPQHQAPNSFSHDQSILKQLLQGNHAVHQRGPFQPSSGGFPPQG